MSPNGFIELKLLPILISLIALWVAFKSYQRKNGIELRGTFQIASSRACEDQFVKSILIENIKDRSITVFDIYLQVGYSIYIHLVRFEENPLILKPYETFQKQFGPIEFYGFNLRKIDINNLLENHKIKKRLILSTSAGKYVVPKRVGCWSPTNTYFKNHSTGILNPMPSRYKNTDLGSNIKYIVEVINLLGNTEFITVGKDDFNIGIFRNFQLSKESLVSKDDLELFLLERCDEGKFNVNNFTIHSVDEWRKKYYSEGFWSETVKIDSDSFLRYHIWGKWLTYCQKREMRKCRKYNS